MRQVFDHWLFMFCKSPARTKLGPTRRAAINAALQLYDLDMLLMAIDGAAADPWVNGDNKFGRPFNDIEWLLATESRVEKLADMGERVRLQVGADEAAQQQSAARVPTPEDAAAKAAERDKLREAAMRMRRAPRHG